MHELGGRYWREESTRELTTVVNRADDDGEIRGRVVLREGAALDRRLGWQEGAAAGGQERVERKIASGMACHL
jgi:hypothetical protein